MHIYMSHTALRHEYRVIEYLFHMECILCRHNRLLIYIPYGIDVTDKH